LCLVAGGIAAASLLSGCGLGLAGQAQEAADSAAKWNVVRITRYVQDPANDVVTPGEPSARQLADLRDFLTSPSFALKYGQKPYREILDATDEHVDIAVWAGSTVTSVIHQEATKHAVACARFTVDDTRRLASATIDCPDGVTGDSYDD